MVAEFIVMKMEQLGFIVSSTPVQHSSVLLKIGKLSESDRTVPYTSLLR
jgi:hypothetical protein